MTANLETPLAHSNTADEAVPGANGAPRVAVVGAGPAGLTAAFALARAGARVVVFEAAAAVGGRTRTDELDGCRVDTATQLFASVYTRFLRVLRAAGGMSGCVRASGRDALWRGGAVHEVVYGSTTSMLASGALPLGLKLKLGAHYLPFLHRHAAALRMDALADAAAAGLDRESIAAWGERELGRGFVDLLAAPLLQTLYGSGPAETSAGFYHALARQGMHLEVLALRGGAGWFCELLASAVTAAGGELRTGTTAHAVSAAPAGVAVETAAGTERFAAAVLAVPATSARSLLGDGGDPLGRWLAGVLVRPAVTVALTLDRPLGVRWFGLSFAGGESRALAAVCMQEAKPAGLVPEGRGALLALPLPAAGERLVHASAAEAVAALLPDLARPFPRIEGMIRGVRVYPWPAGWTVLRPGSLAHLAGFPAAQAAADARIALAGDYLGPPNVEGAVSSGLRAAERVLASLGR